MSDVWKEDASTEVTFTDCPTCKGKGTIVLSRDGKPTDTQGLLEQRDALLQSLRFMTAYTASHSGDGCTPEEGALVDVMLDPEDHGNLQRTIDAARAVIANTEGGE